MITIFPALSPNPPEPDPVATAFFETAPAYGKCEVILYSPEHTVTLPELPTAHIKKLVDLWAERYEALRADEKVKYVFIFENRGEVVGVTMPHPHGQIYAYPFLPKKLELEIENARKYKEEKQHCLFCDMLQAEKDFGERIIFSNEHFTVFLPFFTEYPYGVYIQSNRHITNIAAFNEEERTALAETLRRTTGMLDSLFDYKFPYMMCMYNEPVNGPGCCRLLPLPYRLLSADAQRRQGQIQRVERNRCLGTLQSYLPGGKSRGTARRLC